jgi:EAL domain-containing protein (putative c-di-GMP-specific phosphodiesterase class I)
MYYQPQVDSLTGKITGAEALIRWKHPHYGMVSPGEFIPLAEQSGFIIAMGEWCLFQACSDAMAWDQYLKVSVNVSGVQLRDTRSIIRVVKRALSESSLPPARLTLEITESAMLGNGDDIIDLLAELRKIGISIALDDFGTGYSSLAYIQRLQLDTLKIDQTFVRKLNDSDHAGSMVAIIIDLANLMHLDTVAEGIWKGIKSGLSGGP